jgi:hypothetical protein
MNSKRVGGFVGIGLAVLVGCGGAGGDDTQSGNGALSASSVVAASTPITVQNYVNHPKIKAIRDEVQGIDTDVASGDL